MTEDLRERNQELEREVNRLQEALEKRRLRDLLGWSGRRLTGPALRESFRAWIEKTSAGKRFPPEETAGVLAALVRRVVGVGIIGVLLTVIPTIVSAGFYLWHTDLLRTQIAQQKALIDQQASDTLIVRRAQLLATLYEEDKESCVEVAIEGAVPPRTEWRCEPLASARARQEAARAFLQIQRSQLEEEMRDGVVASLEFERATWPNLSYVRLAGVRLKNTDLSYAIFTGADLTGADLTGAIFTSADLTDADLTGAALFHAYLADAIFTSADLSDADLSGAIFTSADLTGADLSGAALIHAYLADAALTGAALISAGLSGADLTGADLSRADLTGADLSRADLTGADLSRADLTGADLRLSRHLTQSQINQALGDDTTILPEGLSRPAHWAEEVERSIELSDIRFEELGRAFDTSDGKP